MNVKKIGQSLIAAALLCFVAAPTAHARAPKVRHKMLAEGSRPPQFHLTDSGGHSVTLTPFLGRDRTLLVFAPMSDSADAERFVKRVEASKSQYTERDLAVLVIVPPTSDLAKMPSDKPLYFFTDTKSNTAAAYGLTAKSGFYLIGKDGGIKMARHGFPTEKELFATIDTMPMRRQEMKEKP